MIVTYLNNKVQYSWKYKKQKLKIKVDEQNSFGLDIELYVILHFILTIFLMVTFCIFLCRTHHTKTQKTKESVAQFPPSLLFSLMLCYSKIENHTLLMWLVLFGKIRGSFLLKVVSPISIQLFSHVKLHTVPKVKSLFNIKMSQNSDPLRYELW